MVWYVRLHNTLQHAWFWSFLHRRIVEGKKMWSIFVASTRKRDICLINVRVRRLKTFKKFHAIRSRFSCHFLLSATMNRVSLPNSPVYVEIVLPCLVGFQSESSSRRRRQQCDMWRTPGPYAHTCKTPVYKMHPIDPHPLLSSTPFSTLSHLSVYRSVPAT